MNRLHLFLGAALKPLLFINILLMLVAALWLGMLGHFRGIWVGVAGFLFGPFLLFPMLLLPAGIFAHFMGLYQEAGKSDKERQMFIASIAYIILFLTLWAAGIFSFLLEGAAESAQIPNILLAAAAVAGPLWLWASRDRENYFILLLVLAVQGAVVFLSLCAALMEEADFFLSALITAGTCALAAYLQNLIERQSS